MMIETDLRRFAPSQSPWLMINDAGDQFGRSKVLCEKNNDRKIFFSYDCVGYVPPDLFSGFCGTHSGLSTEACFLFRSLAR
jgi:hypothetical protein